ncbi:MAG: hypothetical protein ACRCSY_07900 [Cetobacterium sp.]
MAVQFATYNDDYMETGKFYIVEVNKDNASNLREVTSITVPLAKATQDITEIKSKNDFQEIEINSLKDYFEDYKEIIIDNQSRINNLEDTEIEKIITFLDRVSITKQFENSIKIEIQHNRKSIVSTKIYELVSNNNNVKRYVEIDSGVSIYHETVLENGTESKKVVIESNRPITGYAVIL